MRKLLDILICRHGFPCKNFIDVVITKLFHHMSRHTIGIEYDNDFPSGKAGVIGHYIQKLSAGCVKIFPGKFF